MITVDGVAAILAPLADASSGQPLDPAQRIGWPTSDCSIVPAPPLPVQTAPKDRSAEPWYNRHDLRSWSIEFGYLLQAMRDHLPRSHEVRQCFQAVESQYCEDEFHNYPDVAEKWVRYAHEKLTGEEWRKIWNGWHKQKDVPTADEVLAEINDAYHIVESTERVELQTFRDGDLYTKRFFDISENAGGAADVTIGVGYTKRDVLGAIRSVMHAVDEHWDFIIAKDGEGFAGGTT